MNVFALGASQNIGYHAAVRLLKKGATVTFLLRTPAALASDAAIAPYIDSGHARLVRGDALSADDVARGWAAAQAAAPGGRVDVVVFSIGGALHISPFFVGTISPPNLCTLALLHLLRTLPPSLRSPTAQPKFVVLSTTGATAASHAALPAPVKLFYWWLLAQPHADKRAAERVFARVAGLAWDPRDVVGEGVLPRGWEDLEGMPGEGEIRKVVVVRPAFLTDGPETGRVRAQVEGEAGGEGWTVGRRDVARFVVEEVVGDWEKWEGRRVSVAY